MPDIRPGEPSKFDRRRAGQTRSCPHKSPLSLEPLEDRLLLSAAFDVVGLSTLRADPVFTDIDGAVNGGRVGVAVIDTGLYGIHQDLNSNFVAWFDAVSNGTNSSGPGSTIINDTFDPHGHGTHVAGTAASSNPEVGVAPGAGIIGIRGLLAEGEPFPRVDPVVAGLNWVVENQDRYNIRVINMSLGTSVNLNNEPNANDYSRVINQLEQLGVTVISASGNSYANFQQLGASSPAVFSTFSVANTWEDGGLGDRLPSIGGGPNDQWVGIDVAPTADQLSSTSQRSSLPNQIAAPGSTIFSTWNNAQGLLYNTISGTSMASPLVAGAVALMQDAAFTFGGRYLTVDEVYDVVIDTADDIIDAQNADTLRAPIIRDNSGQIVGLGTAQDLLESNLTFKRINIYSAVQSVRDIVTRGSMDPDPPPDPDERTDDTNHTIDSAIEVPQLNATEDFSFTGQIGFDGQVDVGNNDVDLYLLELISPGNIQLQMEPSTGGEDFTATIRLFDANGALVAANSGNATDPYPELQSGRLAIGTFFVGISSIGNSSYNIVNGSGIGNGQPGGDYQVDVSLTNPDPNGVGPGAAPVDMANPNALAPVTEFPANFFQGLIDSDPNPIDEELPRIQIGPTDVDMFRVVSPDTGILIVDIEASNVYGVNAVDTYVRVFDENLQQIAFNDDEDFPIQLDSYLEVDVEIGKTYYVAVTTFGNRNFNPIDPFDRVSTTGTTGFYDVYMSFFNADVNGTVFGAVNFDDFQLEGTAMGTIGADFGTPLLSVADNGGFKDVDFFFFDVTSDDLLDVTASSSDASLVPALGLWELSSGQDSIDKIFDTAASTTRVIYPLTNGQDVFISVTGEGNQGFNWFAPASGTGGDVGEYQLSVNLRSANDLQLLANDSITANTPTAIAIDELEFGNVGLDGSLVLDASDIDIYEYKPPESHIVRVVVNGSGDDGADPFLRIFNEEGEQLAANDNAGLNTTSSAISLQVLGGQTYYIGVNGASPQAGDYEPLTGSGAAAGSVGDYVLSINEIQPGDFNGDLIIDGPDIDLARMAIINMLNDPLFDVDGIGGSVPNEADFDFLLSNLIGSGRADGNLDRMVTFNDFVLVTNNFDSVGTGWSQGNYNLDTLTDFDDFVVLTNNFGADFTLAADINRDGKVDEIDVDVRREAIDAGTSDPHSNLDGPGEGAIPDQADFDYLLSNMLATAPGDGDLNKMIESDEFVMTTNNFDANFPMNASLASERPHGADVEFIRSRSTKAGAYRDLIDTLVAP